MGRTVWSIGLGAQDIALVIAEGDLTGQVFSSLLKFARFPRAQKAAVDSSLHHGAVNGSSGFPSIGPVPTLSFSCHIKLKDLLYDHCRWPIGDPHDLGFCYCGKQKGNKSRYCDEHHKIAYIPVDRIIDEP